MVEYRITFCLKTGANLTPYNLHNGRELSEGEKRL